MGLLQRLELPGSEDTPQVILDKESGTFEFSGESHPEDVIDYYEPVLEWMEQYLEEPNDSTTMVFRMGYFNSSSSKMLLDVMTFLEDLVEDGKEVLVKWYSEAEDIDMVEAGEAFEEMVEVPFELIEE